MQKKRQEVRVSTVGFHYITELNIMAAQAWIVPGGVPSYKRTGGARRLFFLGVAQILFHAWEVHIVKNTLTGPFIILISDKDNCKWVKI